ncbi:MAG: hypothetical protein ABSH19_00540 [Opitutales bacterium]
MNTYRSILLRTTLVFATGLLMGHYWWYIPAVPRSPATTHPGAVNAHPLVFNSTSAAPTASSDPGKNFGAKIVAWNPNSAVGHILATKTGGERLLAIADLVEQTPVSQLADLINQVSSCPRPTRRDELLECAYAKWAAADPQAALANALAMTRLNPDEDDNADQVFMTWSGHDPQAALAAAETLPNPGDQHEAIRFVLDNWNPQDNPMNAVVAAQNLPDAERDSGLDRAFDGWAVQDPAGALSTFEQVDDPDSHTRLGASLFGYLADRDPSSALSAIASLPADQQSTENYSAIFSSWARQDPSAAANAALNLPDAPRIAAVQDIATAWSDSDLPSAMDWIGNLTGPERDAANSAALSEMITTDPEASSTYINQMPEGPARDNAVAQLASAESQTDPATAFTWATSMQNDQARTSTITSVIQQWAQKDPLAAAAALQSAPIPDSQRQQLLGLVQQQTTGQH